MWRVVSVFLFLFFAPNGTCSSRPLTLDTSLGPTSRQISPVLLKELKDFLDLIPAVILDELVAKYYIIDGNFRTALAYLRSSGFEKLMNETLNVPEVIEVLDFLHLLINDEEPGAIQYGNKVYEYFWQNDIVDMPVNQNANKNDYVVIILKRKIRKAKNYKQSRRTLQTFTKFVRELIQHLPRSQYVAMIQDKRNRCPDFAHFYEALRSPQFRPLVDATMAAKSLVPILNTLHANGIDVKGLEPTAFEVISWGPSNFVTQSLN